MRGMVGLVLAVVAQVTPSHTFAASGTQPVVVQDGISGSPRVVLSIDPKTGQRQVQLVGRGTPGYPTIDVTCDGQRRTVPLARSEVSRSRTVATYVVPRAAAGTMLKAVECRLLIPGQEIALARQKLRAAWASPSKGAEGTVRGEHSR